MIRYGARRLALLVPTLLAVSTVAFLLVHALPGDSAAVMLGPEATPEQVAALRSQLGADDPLLQRYAAWSAGLLRLDLGDSLSLGRPVATAIGERLVPTLQLALYALTTAAILGVGAGTLAARFPRSPIDRLVLLLASGGTAVAGFLLGMLLIAAFSIRWPWLPAGGYVEFLADPVAHLRAMVLPTLALGLPLAGLPARLTRASILAVRGEPYVRTATAKGLSARAVLLRHELRTALVPTTTVLGTTLADLLGGAVVVEIVFNLPGMGQLIATSIAHRDLALLSGTILTAAVVYVLAALLVDLLYTTLDPRLTHVDG